MGIETEKHKSFRPNGINEQEFTLAWLEAIDELMKAAADTAEFAVDRAIGRSRTASIRRLKAALIHLEELEALGPSLPRKETT
jgi:hypothetical protein